MKNKLTKLLEQFLFILKHFRNSNTFPKFEPWKLVKENGKFPLIKNKWNEAQQLNKKKQMDWILDFQPKRKK